MRCLALAGPVLAGAAILAASSLAHGQARLPFAAAAAPTAPLPTPFANNDGQIPPNYPPPLFQLSHDYPALVPQILLNPPWRVAINNGPITVANAGAYVAALKQAVTSDMRLLLTDSPQWNPKSLGW